VNYIVFHTGRNKTRTKNSENQKMASILIVPINKTLKKDKHGRRQILTEVINNRIILWGGGGGVTPRSEVTDISEECTPSIIRTEA
jgi:hypothetical protein